MPPSSSQTRRRKRKRTFSWELALWVTLGVLGLLMIMVNVLLENAQPEAKSSQQQQQQVPPRSIPVVEEKPVAKDERPVVIEDEDPLDPSRKKDKLIEIMKMANVNLTEDVLEALPSWEQVVNRFGAEPKFLGLDTCAAFNAKVPIERRMLAPAGMFNSGTNLLFQILQKNCVVHRRKGKKGIGVEWQVNWGKHQSPRFRFENRIHEHISNADMLPIVIVRDPYTWFQSMCKNRYSAHWYHIVPHHCPNFIANHIERAWFNKTKPQLRRYYQGDPWKMDNVADKANYTLESKVVPLRARFKNEVSFHDSLAHFYTDWYQEYFDADFPRLMIRLEDIVFHPTKVLETLCNCVEGTKKQKKWILEGETSKEGAEHIHGHNKTNLLKAMVMHVYTNLTEGMTHEDVDFARDTLEDSPVFHYFNYQHP